MSEQEKESAIGRIAKVLGKDIAIVRNLSLVETIAELVMVCETQATLLELWVKDDDES